MSRSYRGSKGPGYDFWSRRSGTMSISKRGKTKTKAQERTENKKLERQALRDPDNVRGRFSGE